MILTVEYDEKKETVEIYCDKEGIIFLKKQLDLLENDGGHIHFMTPSWAGQELTEDIQGIENILINHLTIVLKPEIYETGIQKKS